MDEAGRLTEDASRVRPRRVVAVMNQKGGVGKTTTTVNLGAALAEAGHETLLVDLDPQAHATLHLGVDPSAVPASVYDVLLDPDAPGRTVVVGARRGLALLPSEVDLAAAESELAGRPDRLHRLSRWLSAAGDRFEFVLIDCPPSLGLLTLNALVASDEVIVPMQAQFLALQGVGKLLDTVRLIAQDLRPRLRVAGIVLCAHDEGTNHAKEVVADLERFLDESCGGSEPWSGARLLKPAIRRNIKLAECPSFGQTIFEYAPMCAGAADYRRLAEGLLEAWCGAAVSRAPESERRAEVLATPDIVVAVAAESELRSG